MYPHEACYDIPIYTTAWYEHCLGRDPIHLFNETDTVVLALFLVWLFMS